jgi:hypothetical protein
MTPENPAVPTIREDIAEETLRLLTLAEESDTPVRALGGMAVVIRAGDRPRALQRTVEDIDLAAPKGRGQRISEFLAATGYEPNQTFNALHGASRMIFDDPWHGRHIDLFIGRFEMCHALSFDGRLEVNRLTLPVADLVMTKLQIVNLNAKDVTDLYALLLAHELADHDRDALNINRVTELCARDWGTYRTFQGNLKRLPALLSDYDLDDIQHQIINARINALEEAIEAVPKSAKWKLRAKVGDRVRWYADPEEVTAVAGQG